LKSFDCVVESITLCDEESDYLYSFHSPKFNTVLFVDLARGHAGRQNGSLARFREARIPGFATGRTVETAQGESAARVQWFELTKIKTFTVYIPGV
jgi:hypothetical protein